MSDKLTISATSSIPDIPDGYEAIYVNRRLVYMPMRTGDYSIDFTQSDPIVAKELPENIPGSPYYIPPIDPAENLREALTTAFPRRDAD